jgi:hypothetical protein
MPSIILQELISFRRSAGEIHSGHSVHNQLNQRNEKTKPSHRNQPLR